MNTNDFPSQVDTSYEERSSQALTGIGKGWLKWVAMLITASFTSQAAWAFTGSYFYAVAACILAEGAFLFWEARYRNAENTVQQIIAGTILLAAVGYDRLLDGIYHFGQNGWTCKEEMIRAALADFRTPSAVMVGDRASDLQGARGAGVPFIGCLYGYGSEEEVAGADFMVREVRDLSALLLPPASGPAA